MGGVNEKPGLQFDSRVATIIIIVCLGFCHDGAASTFDLMTVGPKTKKLDINPRSSLALCINFGSENLLQTESSWQL